MPEVAKQSTIESSLKAILAHPVRIASWVTLTERVASPNEIKDELGFSVNYVAYHVRQLLKAGVVELVDTKQRRGATEHFYRATVLPFAGLGDWEEMNDEQRAAVTDVTVQLILVHAVAAIKAGTFDSRFNRWCIRQPGVVDEEGFQEMSDLDEHRYRETKEIYARSANRLAEKPVNSRIPVESAAMFYEKPQD